MKLLDRHLSKLYTAFILLLIISCQQTPVQKTEYSKNQTRVYDEDFTKEQWYQDLKQSGVTSTDLNALAYGAGVSNAIVLVNNITEIARVTNILNNPERIDPVHLVDLLNQLDVHLIAGRDAGTGNDTLGKIYKLLNLLTNSDMRALKRIVNTVASNASDPNAFTSNGAAAGHGRQRLALVLARINENVNKLPSLINTVAYPASTYSQDGADKIVIIINQTNDVIRVSDIVTQVTDINKLNSVVASLTLAQSVRLPALINNVTYQGVNSRLGILINNITDMSKVVTLVTGVTDIADLYPILNVLTSTQKLANVVENVTDATKLVTVVNGLTAPNKGRVAELVNGVSNELHIAQLINGVTAGNAARLATIINGVTSTNTLIALVNQLGPQAGGIERVFALINGLDSDKVVRLHELLNNVTDTSRIGNLVMGINDNGAGAPTTSMPRLLSLLNTVNDVRKFYPLINHSTNVNLISALVNETLITASLNTILNEVSDIDNTVSQKMVALVNGVAAADAGSISRISWLVNNTQNVIRIGTLVENTVPSRISYIVSILTGISGTHAINHTQGSRGSATGLGKLVNLIDYSPSPANIATVINGLNSADSVTRLIGVVNGVSNSTNLAGLFTAFTSTAYPNTTLPEPSELANLINGLADNVNNVAKLVIVVNGITASTEAAAVATPSQDFMLLAQLLGLRSTSIRGIGGAEIALLMNAITNSSAAARDAAANRLVSLLVNVNQNPDLSGNDLRYNSATPNISKREALVRLLNRHDIAHGVNKQPENVDLPGIGPEHIGTLMNNASDAASLVTVINGNDIMNVVVLVGCLDRVPHLQSGCNSLGVGW